MNRNSFYRTNKFSLLLFGAGLATLASPVSAQTLEGQPSVVSPDEFRAQVRMPSSMSLVGLAPMADANKAAAIQAGSQTESTSSIKNAFAKSPFEKLASTPVIATSETNKLGWQPMERTTRQPNSDSSIIVDSKVFGQNLAHQANARQPNTLPAVGREIESPAAFKFPVKLNRIKPSEIKPSPRQSELMQTEQVQAESPQITPVARPLLPLAEMTINTQPTASTDERFTAVQISASADQLSRSKTATIPTSIRTPNAIAAQTNWTTSDHMLQPIRIAKQPSQPIADSVVKKPAAQPQAKKQAIKTAQAPVYHRETEFAPSPVSIFIEGPETLKVNQAGDYQITVVNSASEPMSVSSILLQIPEAAELLVIEREARIDDLERTLAWSIAELDSGEQHRIRFRLKLNAAGNVDFPVTISQGKGHSETISQLTIVK